MKGIYKYYQDFGRMGYLSGVFVATADEIEDIIGKEIYFGEVLGKHSEVASTMKEEYFTLVTTNEEFVKMFEDYDLSTGTNPFDDYNEEDYDDEDEDDED